MKLFSINKIVFAVVSCFILIACEKEEEAIKNTNRSPVAEAGAGVTIFLPVTSIWLDGNASTDPENNITSYKWEQKSGPILATIETPDDKRTQVIGLVEGVYQFELTVTDGGKLTSKDDVRVEVIIPANTKTVIIKDQVLTNACYDDRPGVCWINADGPSYGTFIKNATSTLPDLATEILSVYVKLDTSNVWVPAAKNCDSYDPYPQSDFTFCRTDDGLGVVTWFLSMDDLAGRKVDVKVEYSN